MSSSWQNDGRKIPDEVMSYIRQIAVRAVEEKGYSPEDVIKILGLSRSCIYEWLRKYREEGFTGLETQRAPGAKPVITQEMARGCERPYCKQLLRRMAMILAYGTETCWLSGCTHTSVYGFVGVR